MKSIVTSHTTKMKDRRFRQDHPRRGWAVGSAGRPNRALSKRKSDYRETTVSTETSKPHRAGLLHWLYLRSNLRHRGCHAFRPIFLVLRRGLLPSGVETRSASAFRFRR